MTQPLTQAATGNEPAAAASNDARTRDLWRLLVTSLTVVGVHVLALGTAAVAESPRAPAGVLFNSVAVSQLLLLTLFLNTGPLGSVARLGLLWFAGIVAGSIAGAGAGRSYNMACGMSVVYPSFAAITSVYLWVLFLGMGVRPRVLRVEAVRDTSPTRVQFTILSMIGWTLVAALTLTAGRLLAAASVGVCVLAVALLGIPWGCWTGMLMLREPLFPLPRSWMLLSLVVASWACGVLMGLSLDSQWRAGALQFGLTLAFALGTLWIVRAFGYRLQFLLIGAAEDAGTNW